MRILREEQSLRDHAGRACLAFLPTGDMPGMARRGMSRRSRGPDGRPGPADRATARMRCRWNRPDARRGTAWRADRLTERDCVTALKVFTTKSLRDHGMNNP